MVVDRMQVTAGQQTVNFLWRRLQNSGGAFPRYDWDFCPTLLTPQASGVGYHRLSRNNRDSGSLLHR
jgi:hypothetical protein